MRNQSKEFAQRHAKPFFTNSQRGGIDMEDWNRNKLGYVQFRQIDRIELIPNALEALTPLQFEDPDPNLVELKDLKYNHDDERMKKPKKIRKYSSNRKLNTDLYTGENWALKFKMINADSRVVKSILQVHEFEETQGHDWNILWTNTIGKPYLYTGLNEYQKVNHFPSSYEITRKNNLANNVYVMQTQFSRKEFDVIPETYVLPKEFGDFLNSFKRRESNDQISENIWIVKANALSRGRGIYLIDSPAQVNMESPCVVSKYISNPLLINGHKFDLRLYVLVTSFDPLRIYLYKEGLARFCSEKYNLDKPLKNKFMHLTNYSINKKNSKYVKNVDEDDAYGSKWSLTALIKHLAGIGCDTDELWKNITDIIIKSIISGEKHISSAIKRNLEHRGTCFELFGFDVLIDSNYKPWVMEINLSPSLACDAPIDFKIKSKLIYQTLNLVGIKQFDRQEEARKKIKNRTRAGVNHLTKGPQFSKLPTPSQILKTPIELFGSGFLNKADIQGVNKHSSDKLSMDQETRETIKDIIENNLKLPEGQIYDLFKKITYKKKEVLRDTLFESQRLGDFTRIFPVKGTNKYLRYFSSQSNTNKITYDFFYSTISNEEEKKLPEENKGINNFFEPNMQNSVFSNTNKHFLNLESKLRPLRKRPDSAAHACKSTLSTRSSTKPNESSTTLHLPLKKKSTEDILIDYFQGILDNIKNQFAFFSNKQAPVICFDQLEGVQKMYEGQKRRRAKSSYGRGKRNIRSSYAFSSYLVQRFGWLERYFSMTVNELVKDKREQEVLGNELVSIINRLKLVKPRSNKGKNSMTNIDISSHDSFNEKHSIPVISRLRKGKYNGIPRPNRALTAKYRPMMAKNSLRPPTAAIASRNFLPPRPLGKKYSKPRINSAYEHQLLGPIVTKISGSQSRIL
ncbi:unnamed protein product [Moneuplotes crassus]|uniref:Tubulin--tyrosine ligase-like protein 5 n=2 Tax=Euplotes crassus TaxID=5936 RepID=A0AAD1Y2C0_EUPCR|nr:unnamed protein product [Moneuplotes crassus]